MKNRKENMEAKTETMSGRIGGSRRGDGDTPCREFCISKLIEKQ